MGELELEESDSGLPNAHGEEVSGNARIRLNPLEIASLFAPVEESALQENVPEASYYFRSAKQALLNANRCTSARQSVVGDFFKK